MDLIEFIDKFQDIASNNKNAKVYMWNENKMQHVPVRNIKFIQSTDFVDGLKDDKDYVDDFNMILNNIVLS